MWSKWVKLVNSMPRSSGITKTSVQVFETGSLFKGSPKLDISI